MKTNLGLALMGLLLVGNAFAGVTVDAPWVRSVVPGQSVTGAFMTLSSDSAASLTGVSSPVAGHAEIHEMKMQGDVMQMRAVSVLPLPKGKAVTLSPGGFHIMLFDLKAPLKVGEKVPLTLTVQEKSKPAEKVQVEAVVKDGFK